MEAMVRLRCALLDMIGYTKDRLLAMCNPPYEAPEELRNSGIGVLARDGSTDIPEDARDRSDPEPTQQGQPPAFGTEDVGVHHCLGFQSEMKGIGGGMDVSMALDLQCILSKLEITQEYASLARQVRQHGISSSESLRGLISLIFANAVMHPTQCALYARLCVQLNSEMTTHSEGQPGDKPITFHQVLLEEIGKLTKPQLVEGRDEKEKPAKSSALGNAKLIGALFNEKVLSEEIVFGCLTNLLGQDPKATPAEENVEALCALLKTVWTQLEKNSKSTSTINNCFARLEVIQESTALPSRIRSMVSTVLDLSLQKGASRPEKRKAKKIKTVGAEAKFELRPEMALDKGSPAAIPELIPDAEEMMPGILRMPVIPAMPQMPLNPGAGVGLLGTPMMASFTRPAPEAYGCATASNMLKSPMDGARQFPVPGFLGLVRPLGKPTPIAAGQGRYGSRAELVGGRCYPRPRHGLAGSDKPKVSLGTGSLKAVAEHKSHSQPSNLTKTSEILLKEYFLTADLNKARLRVQVLNSPRFPAEFVRLAIVAALDLREECRLVLQLLVHLQSKRVISSSDLEWGVLRGTEALGGMVIDKPLAAKLLGGMLADLAMSSAVELRAVEEALRKLKDECLQQAVLQAAVAKWKAQENEEQLGEVCRKALVDKEALLSVVVVSDLVEVIELGVGRAADTPKLMVRGHSATRSNKDAIQLRGLLRRVQSFGK